MTTNDISKIGQSYEARSGNKLGADGNKLLLDTLEEFAEAGGWYLDLLTMEFTALGKKTYEIYGLPDNTEVDYKQFLFQYVHIEDQHIAEQVRMRLISGESPVFFEHRIIKQDTGEIKLLNSVAYRVEDQNKVLVGLRGITMYAKKQPRKASQKGREKR